MKFPDEFDLHINNGRMLEHFHEGNLTDRSSGIHEKVPENFVEVSPELAEARDLRNGSVVRLVPPHGAVKVPVGVTGRVRGNELFLPMHSVKKERAINFLTGPATDQRTNTPAFKQTMVRMEVLQKDGHDPLPKTNHRTKRRHPTRGVEVERKWQRPDHVPLTDQPEER